MGINSVILASKSPRRKELLESLGLTFEIISTEVEEVYQEGFSFEKQIQLIAFDKAIAVHKEFQDSLVIAGDTIVVCEDQLLGKPKNEAKARQMLSLLAGRHHSVITGICVIDSKDIEIYSEVTEVFVKDVSLETINTYIYKYHPLDKAGAYGIQDDYFQQYFLDMIQGEYENVMGLPLLRLKKILERKKKL